MQSGSEVLELIDHALERGRAELAELDGNLQRAGADFAAARQSELGIFTRLAHLRLRDLERGQLIESLSEADRKVQDILAERGRAEETLAANVAAAEAELAERERERAVQQAAAAAASRALDAAETLAQQQLAEDAEYRALLTAADDSDRVADLAEEKAAGAQSDRLEKGKPYEVDPLFMYLWDRGYGTSRYRAGPLTRLLDGTVARVGKFEGLRRNYAVLTEIPQRLSEHAQRMREAADRDIQRLRDSEQRVAAEAGVPPRRRELDTAETQLTKLDEAIQEQEAAVAALIDERGRFGAREDDFSARAAEFLGQALRREDIDLLRERAARTASGEDDALVDRLADLENTLERLRIDVTEYRRLHQAQRERLARVEEVRRWFKESRYDDPHSVFEDGGLVATVLARLLVGAVASKDVWDTIKRQQRYRHIGADPRFGSGRFPRFPGGGSWHRPGGGGGWNFPKSGGGFGGGGFRTGGGFGRGGGFKTGGRF